VLEAVAGHSGQPVVGVQHFDIGADQVGLDAVGELLDPVRQVFLGCIDGTCVDMHDLEARLDGDPLGQVGSPPAHVDLHRYARTGQ